MNVVCNNCADEEEYPSADGRSCGKLDIYNCTHIVGCAQCVRGYDDMCYSCDEDKHFTDSNAYEGKCFCMPGYDLVNNQCVEEIKPEQMPTVPENAFETPLTTTNGVATTTGFDATKPSYAVTVEPAANKLELPSSNNKDVYVDVKSRNGSPLELKVDKNTPLIVKSTDPETTLSLPKENDITVEAQNKLTVNPISGENATAVNIANLRPTGELSLDSTADITINELDIYGVKTLTGQPSNEAPKTKCTNARLARGSSFTPVNLIIDNVEVGLISKVLLKQSKENVQIGKFIIDYNKAQDSNIPIPFSFTDHLPDLSKTKIIMNLVDATANLQEEETYTLAEFKSIGSDVKVLKKFIIN